MDSSKAKVKTRFAPSPTGALHIGGVRTALFSWLFARRHDGEFVLRMDDTDRERSTKESERDILEGFEWLGIDYDGEVVYQTQRLERYHEVAQKLLGEGAAYHCHCSAADLEAMREEQIRKGAMTRYDGRCRARDGSRTRPDPAVRFMSPTDGEVTFHDIVYGDMAVANEMIDDFVMIRSDGIPTYNFAAVVDDMDMGVTHIIRGEDHLSNTAKQINLWRAICGEDSATPKFAHIPMILDEDGKRLSKRSGAAGLQAYKDAGYLPDALLNYLVRLGWSFGDQEVFSREEMIANFNLEHISHAAATINPKKLNWLNKHYMQEMPLETLATLLKPHLERAGITNEPTTPIVAALRARYDTLRDMAEGATFFYVDPQYAQDELRARVGEGLLREIGVALNQVPQWDVDSIKDALDTLAKAQGVKFGKVGAPLRYVLTGGMASPSIAETAHLIGRQACLRRIDAALSKL